jgi:F-type H+-transporting ATPase subunit alpha
VPVEEVRRYEEELYRFLEARASGVLNAIVEKKILDDQVRPALEAALAEFTAQFTSTVATTAAA